MCDSVRFPEDFLVMLASERCKFYVALLLPIPKENNLFKILAKEMSDASVIASSRETRGFFCFFFFFFFFFFLEGGENRKICRKYDCWLA